METNYNLVRNMTVDDASEFLQKVFDQLEARLERHSRTGPQDFIELTTLKPNAKYEAQKGDKITVRPEHIVSISPGTHYEFTGPDGREVGATIGLSSGQTHCVYEDYYEVFYKINYEHLTGKELEEAQKKCKHEWGPTKTEVIEPKFHIGPNPPRLVHIMSRTCKKCRLEEWQSVPYYE